MIPLRLAQELTYQLDESGERERLAHTLSEIPIFLTLWKDSQFAVLAYWRQLSVHGHLPEDFYSITLDRLRTLKHPRLLIDALSNIQGLLQSRGAHEHSMALLEELLSLSQKLGDRNTEMHSLRVIGLIYHRRGDYNHAMEYYSKSLELAESLGDKLLKSYAIGSIGAVNSAQGRYSEALSCYQMQFALAEELHDKLQMLQATGNTGNVHREQGRYADALACYNRTLELARAIGDERQISLVIGIIGSVHVRQGHYAEALACYKHTIEMAQSIGDEREMSIATGNLGTLFHLQGRYSEALACYEQNIAVADAILDKRMKIFGTGHIGLLKLDEGAYDEAIPILHSALDQCQLIGDRRSVTYFLCGLSRAVYLSHGDLAQARKYAEECIRLSEEMSIAENVFEGSVLLCCIDAAEGKAALAVENLERMRSEADDEEQIAELQYWLWKINPSDSNHRDALFHYTNLVERMPKFEYRKRIAELKGERIPRSADNL